MAFKRICHTCGKEYEYCPTCRSFESLPKWMSNWDSEECKDVWNILVRYNTEHISKDEVKVVLDSYGVSNYGKYVSPISAQLKEIFAEEKTKKQPKATEKNEV